MKLLLALVAVIGLSFGVLIYVDIASQPASVISTTFTEEIEPVATATIVRTRSGYEPAELAIEMGTVVKFLNDSSSFHWPASNDHPTHTTYPAFDPKKALAPGEEWSMQFDKPGTWQFHDHLRAGVGGVIQVEDPSEKSFEIEEGQIIDEMISE